MDLKQLRQKTGNTQAKFSRIINVPYVSYRAYEKGTRKPKYSVMQRIAEGLDVPVNTIIDLFEKGA